MCRFVGLPIATAPDRGGRQKRAATRHGLLSSEIAVPGGRNFKGGGRRAKTTQGSVGESPICGAKSGDRPIRNSILRPFSMVMRRRGPHCEKAGRVFKGAATATARGLTLRNSASPMRRLTKKDAATMAVTVFRAGAAIRPSVVGGARTPMALAAILAASEKDKVSISGVFNPYRWRR